MASLPNTPRPKPASTLPPDKLSRKAISSASLIGFQNVAILAACPILKLDVRAAISADNKMGFGIHSISPPCVDCKWCSENQIVFQLSCSSKYCAISRMSSRTSL